MKSVLASVSTMELENLPEELQIAQKAIETEEVQGIHKVLAKYNLGVCMPHMHTDGGGFTVLPPTMVQVENGLKVSFAARNEVEEAMMVLVAWRWEQNGVTNTGLCPDPD